jgi:tol-pal system protein YbgF
MTRRAAFAMSGACAAALALAACSSTPAEDDPVQIKLRDLDTRLARIERVMANQSLLDLSNQLEALSADVRAVHNDVDQLNNSLESGRKQTRALYADLDQRIRALEARGGAGGALPATGAAGVAGAGAVGAAGTVASAPATGAVASAPGSAGGDPNGAASDDKSSYQAAVNLLKDSQYDKAAAAFRDFLAVYPTSSLADNAQYWLGEAFYVNRAFPDAQSAFQRVIDQYPQSRKVPDALLKIGYCRYEMKLWDSAKEVLKQVIAQFPDTPASRLAQQRLELMAAEKH